GQGTGLTAEQQSAKAVVKAQQREINVIKGYKPELNEAENQRLTKIQAEIQKINARVVAGTAREDEIYDRGDLYLEADRIIGKPSADVTADATLEKYNAELTALLEPKLDSALARRVEGLQR